MSERRPSQAHGEGVPPPSPRHSQANGAKGANGTPLHESWGGGSGHRGPPRVNNRASRWCPVGGDRPLTGPSPSRPVPSPAPLTASDRTGPPAIGCPMLMCVHGVPGHIPLPYPVPPPQGRSDPSHRPKPVRPRWPGRLPRKLTAVTQEGPTCHSLNVPSGTPPEANAPRPARPRGPPAVAV